MWLIEIDFCYIWLDQNDSHGEFLLEIDESCLFVVVGYNGDPELQFLCVQSNRLQLDHNGWSNEDLYLFKDRLLVKKFNFVNY